MGELKKMEREMCKVKSVGSEEASDVQQLKAVNSPEIYLRFSLEHSSK